ncbi:MAG: iron ABC transporter permease [Myxococcales bacterium]|nr:iron ABC transporter permease [Myxococcales bacterium]
MRRRALGGHLVALAALGLSVGVALSSGGAGIPLGRTIAILAGGIGLPWGIEGAPWERVVLLELRLPRVLLAACGGGGLAIAGAAMQGLFRNPMADPGILGVSGGAALGAVCALYIGGEATALYTVPLAAFVGAGICAFLVYVLATRRARSSIASLLLAGIAVGGVANALTSFVLTLSLADWEVGREMLVWLMGGLDARSWRHVAMAAPPILGGSSWLLIYARELDVLAAGEQSALSLGVDVRALRRDLIVLTSIVTAATVAVMGIVGFVGLMVPHLVRLLVGPRHARLLPLSFWVGAIALVWADWACRSVVSTDLRLGVITALAGGPFFLYLLVRHQRGSER